MKLIKVLLHSGFLFTSVVLGSVLSYAIPIIDATFGNDGITRIGAPAGFEDKASASTMQTDGKLIVAGTSRGRTQYAFVARYTTSGTPDPTYGISGVARLTQREFYWMTPIQLELQADGSLIIVGTGNYSGSYMLAKLNPSGVLDTRFGTSGSVEFDINGTSSGVYGTGIRLATQADGKLLIVTDASANDSHTLVLQLRRFLATGIQDSGYGSGSLLGLPRNFAFDSTRLAVADPNGGFTMIARGTSGVGNYLVLRINPDATLDKSFGGVGYVSGTEVGNAADIPEQLVRTSGNRYVIVGKGSGQSSPDVVWKLESNGQLTNPFAGGRLGIPGSGALSRGVVAFSDESVVVARGFAERFQFERYDSAGNAVSGFGFGGAVSVPVPGYPGPSIVGLHQDGDGGVTLAGTAFARMVPDYYQTPVPRGYDVLVAGLSSSGILRSDFGIAGVAIWNDPALSNDRIDAIQLDASGRIVIAGYSDAGGYDDFLVSRLGVNGAPDPAYGNGSRLLPQLYGRFSGPARAAALDDGTTVVAASAPGPTAADRATTMFRATAQGQYDTTFKPAPVGAIPGVSVALAARPDGRVLYGTRAPSGSYVVQQFLPNGSADPSFGVSGEVRFESTVPGYIAAHADMRLLPDGSAVFAVFALQDIRLYKINPDGSVAKSFGTDGVAIATADPLNGFNSGNDDGQTLLMLSDGSFVVAQGVGTDIFWPSSEQPTLFVARVSATGQVTSAVNVLQGASFPHWSLAALPDDSVMIARSQNASSVTLDRLLPDGLFDASFGSGSMFAPANFTSISVMAHDADGRLIVAGQDRDGAIVARYRLDSAAHLAAQNLSLTLGGRGSGTVWSNVGAVICKLKCDQAYPYGGTVTLVAAPDAGSQFVGWLGDCTGRDQCTVTMTRAITVSALFAPAATPRTLDVDGNGKYEALADGLLLIRYLFGLTGDDLTAGIVTGSSAFLETLNDRRPVLDVDGNGQADALTDGVLILRYLFGLRGNELITNAIGAAATRTIPDAVIRYLQTLAP